MNENKLQSFSDTGADIPPENPKNKKILFGVLGIAVGIIAVAGFLFWQTQKEDNRLEQAESVERQEQETQTERQAVAGEEIDTSTWQTYRNEEYGFEVKYPSYYFVRMSGERREGGVIYNLFAVDIYKEVGSSLVTINVTGPNFVLGTRDWQDFELGEIEGSVNYNWEDWDVREKVSSAEIIFTSKNNQTFFITTRGNPLEDKTINQILATFRFVEQNVQEEVSVSGEGEPSDQVDDFAIISPGEGTRVSSGETVPVIIHAEPRLQINRVLLVGLGIAQTDESRPFEFDMVIPVEMIGEFQISALGSDSNNNFFESNKITLQVVSVAVLKSINLISKDPILFGIGEKRNLNTVGNFSDGTVRDITSSTTGTEYLTSNSEIVTVSPEGVITSVSEGFATVIALNRSAQVQDSISVRVIIE